MNSVISETLEKFILSFPTNYFITNNPQLIIIILAITFLIYLYVTSEFRFKTPHFFAYSTNLSDQVNYWTENFSEDVMNLYKLDPSKTDELKAIFGTKMNTNLFQELKQKVNSVFQDDIDVVGDHSKMGELLQERLMWAFVTIHDEDDNVYDQNAQTRFSIFDLIVFMTNNFANLKEQNMLFYLNNEFEDNVKYFVNKAKNKHDESITPPSLNQNTNNNVDYFQTSIIPYISNPNYFENLTNVITIPEDGKLPDKIDESIIHEKYKEVLRLLFNKVIDFIDETINKEKNLASKIFKSVDNWIEDNPLWKNEKSIIKRNDTLLKKFFHTKDNYFSSYFEKLENNDNENTNTENIKQSHFVEFIENNYDNYVAEMEKRSSSSNGDCEPTDKALFEAENRFKFEKLIFEFESEAGHGLLMKDYSFIEDEIITRYHSVINLHNYNKNICIKSDTSNNCAECITTQSIIQKAYDHKENINETHINAFYSLNRLHIALSVEFPKILHYDTKHSVDIGRLNMYYNNLFKNLIKRVNYYINEFTNGLPKLYTKHKITLHKKFNNFLINMLVNIAQKMRDYFKWIRDNLGKYIVDTVESAIEGYKDPKINELVEEFKNNSKEEYRDVNNNVVEPFLGVGKFIKGIGKSIAKPFMDVIKSFKVILKILKLITNPIAIIKLIVAIFIMVITIALAFIDIVKIITGTIAAIVIASYLMFSIVYMFYYTLIMQVIRLIDVGIFKGYLHKFLYEYFLANEKDIRNWFMTPSYEQGNESHRLLLMPFSQCSEGYKPGILFCHKISKFVPTYSYHANIHRKAEGLDIKGDAYMKEFKPDANFYKFSKSKKNRTIKSVNMQKDAYIKKMDKRLSLYDNLSKATCFSVDSIDGLDDSVKTDVKQLCSNLYCQNGKFQTFCSSYNNINTTNFSYDIVETYIHLTSYILMLIAIIVITTISFHDAKLLNDLPNNIAKIFKPLNKVVTRVT